jgi:hypothetical protein
MNAENDRPYRPIYTTSGDFGGFLEYPMIYNLSGEWIGWVAETDEVYSVHGEYVGWFSRDSRILRKRIFDFKKPRLKPPASPKRVVAPASFPLPPMMAELSFDTIDILEEEPERLPTLDTGDSLKDMD